MSGAVSQRVGRAFGANQAARVCSDAGAESPCLFGVFFFCGPPLGWVVVRISAPATQGAFDCGNTLMSRIDFPFNSPERGFTQGIGHRPLTISFRDFL